MKKKGIIIVVILAVIAIVLAVVFIMLFKDKDTTDLSKDLNQSVTQGYLAEEKEEYQKVYAYLVDFSGVAGTDNEAYVEATNFYKAYEACANIAEFFNNELPYMEYTKTYKTSRKDIKNNLESAQESAENLIEKIEKYSEATGGSELWQRVVWNNCKEYVEDIIYDTMSALELLAEVYNDSVESDLLNNDLTDVLFMGMRYLNKSFRKNVSVSNENVGDKLLTFSQNAFSPDNVEQAIISYSYSSEANKNKMKDILDKGSESGYWPDVLSGNILYF